MEGQCGQNNNNTSGPFSTNFVIGKLPCIITAWNLRGRYDIETRVGWGLDTELRSVLQHEGRGKEIHVKKEVVSHIPASQLAWNQLKLA
jgi:hypothetical protein